jgi:uncharacterized membrane protein YcaP (DUF421 family)
MKKEDIHLWDIKRILLGEAPPSFLLETLVRSIISFAILLLIVRLLGKRMSGKLTSTEMSVQLMFGAIVSSAMQIPDRGILEGGFALLLVLLFQRGFTYWTIHSEKAEDIILGNISLLIKDGVLQLKALEKETISRNQLFAKLRTENIKQLGEIKRLYMETNGQFSIYKNKEKPPGLTIYPDGDREAIETLKPHQGIMVCKECGFTHEEKGLPENCPVCESHNWKVSLES